MFYLTPLGYSYYSSELNLRIHIPKSNIHFVYTVGLHYSEYLISQLYTRVQIIFRLVEPQNFFKHKSFTLSHFRGLFNDHIRPIIIFQLFQSYPKVLSSISWMDNNFFKERYRTFPILFYKDKKCFS